jgi:hypothetical protein
VGSDTSENYNYRRLQKKQTSNSFPECEIAAGIRFARSL